MERTCSHCQRPSAWLQRCAGCRAVWYCSRVCQKRDWAAAHKRRCKWTDPWKTCLFGDLIQFLLRDLASMVMDYLCFNTLRTKKVPIHGELPRVYVIACAGENLVAQGGSADCLYVIAPSGNVSCIQTAPFLYFTAFGDSIYVFMSRGLPVRVPGDEAYHMLCRLNIQGDISVVNDHVPLQTRCMAQSERVLCMVADEREVVLSTSDGVARIHDAKTLFYSRTLELKTEEDEDLDPWAAASQISLLNSDLMCFMLSIGTFVVANRLDGQHVKRFNLPGIDPGRAPEFVAHNEEIFVIHEGVFMAFSMEGELLRQRACKEIGFNCFCSNREKIYMNHLGVRGIHCLY